ncbi:MAG TPA: TraB/GumN family protein [Methanocorpusculum sp.]|nr:TraB/GumN family protein [Methanocorpusculum sp.]
MTEIHIVGTAHVSQQSIDDVRTSIETNNPDVIAIELDSDRFKALIQQIEKQDQDQLVDTDTKNENPDVKNILHGNFTLMLIQWILAYIQRKIGMNVGIEPGSEMKEAIKIAKERNIPIVLIDRNIKITLARFWGSMGIIEKIKLIWVLITSVIGKDDENDDTTDNPKYTINDLTKPDVIELAISEFHKFSPNGAKALIDERDAYLANGIINLERDDTYKSAVVVVGAGHVPGITKYRQNPQTLPPISDLNRKPSHIPILKIIGYLFIILFASITIAMIFAGKTETLFWVIIWWIILHTVFAGIATIIARGHPISILVASSVSWLTSLVPFISCGIVTGLVEAKLRPPTFNDIKSIAKANSFSDLNAIPLFKILLVAVISNLGSSLGSITFIIFITPILGINIDTLKDILWTGYANFGEYIVGLF